MINWTEITIKDEQRRDLLRQADKQRLIQQMQSGRRQRLQRFRHVIDLLISWLA